MRSFYGGLLAVLLSTSSAFAAEPHVTVNRGNVVSTVPSVAQAQSVLAKIPGAASVVDSKNFENQYVLTYKDMLSQTPGVFAQPRYGEEVRLSIRGSGLSRSFHLRGITLLQDGVPFNLADGGGDFQELDPLLIQHLEVYRGGNALQYGANSLGGAINAVTPSARLVPYNYMLRMEGGSYGTLRLHAATAQKTDTVDAYLAATKSVVGGYRDQSEQSKERLYGNVGVKLSDNAETRFYFLRNNLDQEVPSALSRTLALSRPKTVDAINKTNDYHRDINSTRVANKTTIRLNDVTTLDIGAFASTKKLYHPIFQVVDQNSTDLGAFARLDGKIRNSAIGTHDYVLGVNGSKGHVDALRYLNVQGNRGALTANADQDANNLTLYGQDSWYFQPDMALVVGAQAYRSRRELEDNLNAANNDGKTYTGISPKAGLLWNILPTANVFANVTASSEVPTFSELVQTPVIGFVPLKPQKALTYEIGSRGEYGAWSWDIAAYHANVEDELLAFTVDPSIPASIFNANKTIHQGIELGAGYQLTPELNASLTYTFSNYNFDGDAQYGNNTLPGTPRHLVHAQLDYKPLQDWTVSPTLDWTPDGGYVDYANTLDAPGYAVLGLKSDYKVNEHLNVFLDARNLTDEKFITNYNTITNANVAGINVFFPGDGRSLYAGFTVKF